MLIGRRAASLLCAVLFRHGARRACRKGMTLHCRRIFAGVDFAE